MIIRRCAVGILLSFLFACGAESSSDAHPKREGLAPGTWTLDFLPDGPRCGLDLDAAGGATLINGEERIAIPRVRKDGGGIRLGFPHFDSEIVLDAEGRGTWTKTKSGGRRESMPVELSGRAPETPAGSTAEDFLGTWRVRFASDDRDSIGRFALNEAGLVRGTFETETGDYRFLAGGLRDGELRLSCFDGAHAFDFRARLQNDGTLVGTFRSGLRWRDTWTARRDDAVALADGFSRSRWQGDRALGDLVFRDPAGGERRVREALGGAGPAIVYLFGTWCPNCHDAAVYLGELAGRFGPRGLKILGLAFELSDEEERTRRQIESYRERHDVAYPVLWAGPADKTRATEAFAALDRVRSYPTFLFVDREGAVRSVYSGFAGPATGESYTALKKAFEARVESLLAP